MWQRGTTPPVRTVPGAGSLPTPWRAALTILRSEFACDEQVWSQVQPGVYCHLRGLVRDLARPPAARLMLACAQSILDGTERVPLDRVADLSDDQLRLVLDALAIARGSLPVD